MIINKEVLGKLLLAAGYGKLVSVSEAALIRTEPPVTAYSAEYDQLEDFNITVEVAESEVPEGKRLLKYCLEIKKTDDLAGTPVIGRQMVVPKKGYSKAFRKATNRVAGYDIIWVSAKKKMRKLKGLTIESVKTYIRTTDGGTICIKGDL